jgi:CheY-like chemotaxis protein
MELSFILIDDTELDHFIAKKMIRNINRDFDIVNFYDAEQALEYIQTDSIDPKIKIMLVFLDIYMPMMNGFEFIEEFEKLEDAIREKYYIVALTSSREISDIRQINSYSSVKSMLLKPVMSDDLSELLNKVIEEYNVQLN